MANKPLERKGATKRSQVEENIEKRIGKEGTKGVLLKGENGTLFNCPIMITDMVVFLGVRVKCFK
jgi:hypothetical protein